MTTPQISDNGHSNNVNQLLDNDLLFQYIRLSESCLMFADAKFIIQFVNHSALQLFSSLEHEFVAHLPFFNSRQLVGLSIDVFHKNPETIQHYLGMLTSAWSSNLYIGQLVFKIVITPIDHEHGRLGYVVQWKEQSEEIALIGQIEEFIHVIKHHNRHERMNSDTFNDHYFSRNEFKKTEPEMAENSFNVKKGLESILDHLKESTLEEIQSERLNTIGFMAAGIAHEINNPISGVLANMMYLKALCVGDEIHAVIEENIGELTRIAKIVQGLLGFSRSNNKVSCHPVQLGSAIDNVMQLVNLQLKSIQFLDKEQVKVVSHIPSPVHLLMPVISENNFIQILLNLVMNAIHALHDAHIIKPTVEIHASISNDEHFLEISVSDNGPGISDSIKNKIFMPFFTTKGQGMGTGMGLALSLNMAKECQGVLYLDESYTTGCRFVLKIPIETQNDFFDLECFSVIKSILEDDFETVIQSFIHLSKKDLGYIKKSFGQKNFDLLDQDVHRLKGMSISICAKVVQKSCHRMLELIKTGDSLAIEQELLVLENSLMETIHRLTHG